jgi:hypothetical protein
LILFNPFNPSSNFWQNMSSVIELFYYSHFLNVYKSFQVIFPPINMDAELGQSWDNYFNRILEHFEKVWPVRLQTVESFEDRVEAAAVTAWSNGSSMCPFVTGDVAYSTLNDIYFSLRKQLYQYSNRTTFTKEECEVLLSLLCSETVVAKARRRPAQILNAQLKEGLSRIPIFPIAELQEAAKKCANAVASSSLSEVKPDDHSHT